VLSLLVAHSPGETRVALTRNGLLAEFHMHRPGAPDAVGDLYWARVISHVPAMAGAFVSLGEIEAFLPDSDGAAGRGTGDHLAVRVTRAAQAQKGPRVTARLTAAESALATAGAVRRLAAGLTPLEELRGAYPEAVVREGPFGDALEAEIEALAGPAIMLPGGMRGTITPTPALTAIDLDSGGATAARMAKAAAQFAANRDAMPELARQIALRNLSGAILVDFSGVATRKRAALLAPLRAALAADRLRPRLVGLSALGFAEILRPRLRPALHERAAGPHAAGLAALRHAAREAAVAGSRRLVLRAAPAVVAALEADQAARADIARVMTYPLALRSDPALAEAGWVIEDVRG
jgi:Ribonuclease G/E